MANIQIGYDGQTFDIPESTTVSGTRGTRQALTFTQKGGGSGWSLQSINFSNPQFSESSNNGHVIVVHDAFTDAILTSHKFTVTIGLSGGGSVTSPDPVIVNDPISPRA